MNKIIVVVFFLFVLNAICVAQEDKVSPKQVLAAYSINKLQFVENTKQMPEMKAYCIDNLHQTDSVTSSTVQPRLAPFAVENDKK
jgi:hypothetical protein